MLTLLMFVILIACIGFCYTDGMWSNAIRLVNVVTAALLATNFFEPVATWAEGINDFSASYTYALDFLALWGLFGLFMIIFRLGTDLVSRVKVRFMKIADRIGSVFFAAWTGWVMVCFTMMSLHTAPLSRNFMGKRFKTTTEERMVMGLAPDRQWLGFVQSVSRYQFGRSATKTEMAKRTYGVREKDPKWEQNRCVFDRNGELLPTYATRRANLANHMMKPTTKSIRINLRDLPKK